MIMEWVFLILYKILKRIPNNKPRSPGVFCLWDDWLSFIVENPIFYNSYSISSIIIKEFIDHPLDILGEIV
jgi:hypothetical protein